MKDGLKEYQVGELAKFYGVSGDTIRLYDKKGILPSRKNEENNYRLYERENFIMMDYVMRLKKIGFSLEDICHVVNDIPIEETLVLLQEKENALMDEIRKMALLREMIDDFKQSVTGMCQNLGEIIERQSPAFICSNISDTEQETMEDFAKLELGSFPILSIKLSNVSFLDDSYFDRLSDREDRAKNAQMFISATDKKNIHQNSEFPRHRFQVIPAGKSLYFAAAIKTNVDYRGSAQLAEYIKKNSIRVKREPLVRLISIQNNKSDSTDFYEYWVPIE